MRSYNLNSAASTNSTRVNRNGCTVFQVAAFNAGAGVAFLKIYDKGSAAPVVGTDVPIAVLAIPAGLNASLPIPRAGLQCVNGLGIAITGAAADTDTTAVAASQVKVNIGYAGQSNS